MTPGYNFITSPEPSIILSYLVNVGMLKCRSQFDGGLVQGSIGSAYLNAYLPAASHGEVATGAEMAFAIGKQVDAIGTHVHIEHGGIERDANVGGCFPYAVIDYAHSKDVGAEAIRID